LSLFCAEGGGTQYERVFVQLLRHSSYVPYAAFTLGGNYMLRNPDFVTNLDFKMVANTKENQNS
jgi:hypothetical protein